MTQTLTKFFIKLLFFSSTLVASTEHKKHVLLNLHFRCPDPGGIESHLVGLNKIFAQNGIDNTVVTSKHSSFLLNAINQRSNYGPLCETYEHDEFDATVNDLQQLCKKHRASTIVCNWLGSLDPSIIATGASKTKIIYMHHNFDANFGLDDIARLNKTKGIIAVSPMITQHLKRLQEAGTITVKHITHIAPFWDEDKFLHYKPTRSRTDFLKQAFNIIINNDYPIICSVANLYWYKNHKVLLNALGILQNQHRLKFHLLLAGDGPERTNLETQTRELGLTHCVHFLGKTLEVVELLHHADLHVLASSHESFGLAHLEAAMMQKPFIGASGTGAEGFIQNGVTGLIFENNNGQDLAEKLLMLLDNAKLRDLMGKRAYRFTRQHYAVEVLFNKWVAFLEKI